MEEKEIRQGSTAAPATSPNGGAQQPRDERKLVTVMFADLCEFTSLAEKMDPEQVRDLVNACFEQLVPIVAEYGGTVNRFLGDSILALFGAPLAHENDPERALRAALKMQEAMASFNAKNGTDLGMHIGINTGLVVAGGIGSSDRHDYSVTGDAANLAARLQGASGRGEILVGPDTYRLTSHLFEFQPAGRLKLKGKTGSVPAYGLLGFRRYSTASRSPGVRGIGSPLVGRDPEVAAFTACIQQLLGGRGGVISVIAEAGLGKSRLVAEVRRRVAGEGLSWLEGRAISFGHSISYWPFQEIIRADAGITSEDDAAAGWAKLESRATALSPSEAAEHLPYLATLLGVEVPREMADQLRYVGSDAMGRQLFRGVRWLFSRLAQEHPLVLVFEDIHWLDDSSVALLKYVLPLASEVPMLICVVGRPGLGTAPAHLAKLPVHSDASRSAEIRLLPLSQTETEQLVRNLVAIDDFSPHVRESILRKAEGNPFFVEEVIRALIDQGGLARDRTGQKWRATAQAEEIAIPDTLHGVIAARIDRLDEQAKQVLKLASLIGRSFSYRVLARIAEPELEMDSALEELQALELVREKSRLPEPEYIFKHALVQEAAYESVLMQQRKELHRRVGASIEDLFESRLEELSGVLAYHYSRAEDWAKAQEYLVKAGNQAGRIAADAEAVTHYRQAMATYARAFGDKWDPTERAMLEQKMGEALYRKGDHEQARDYLYRTLTSLGSPFPTSRWAVRLNLVRQVLRQIGHRLLPSLCLRPLTGHAAQIAGIRCRVYQAITWIDSGRDNERVALGTLLSLNLSERCELFPFVALGFSFTGMMISLTGLHRLAYHYLYRGVEVAEAVGHPIALGHAYFALAMQLMFWSGENSRAIPIFHQSAKGFRQAGDLLQWGYATYYAARALEICGDPTRSLELGRQITRTGKEAADRMTWALGLLAEGPAYLCRGSIDAAIESLETAKELGKGALGSQVVMVANGFLARCYLKQGLAQAALEVLEESRQRISEPGRAPLPEAPIWMGLAEARILMAERADAATRKDALKIARDACGFALKAVQRYPNFYVGVSRNVGTCDWLQGRHGAAKRWWQRSVELASMLGMSYELALTYLEMGERMGDRSQLEQAGAIFEQIGAQFDLARTRTALRALSEPAQ